jgi:hypothetical protein
MKLVARGLVAGALLGACGDDTTIGSSGLWEPGQPGCQDDFALRSIGETWARPANCTVCECVEGNQIECKLEPWPVPECPTVEGCPATAPVCDAGTWRCADTCAPCLGLEPEPCPAPDPDGCTSGGQPRCSEQGDVDRWLCEPHFCQCAGPAEVCGVGPTGCPQYSSCGPDGWECTSICPGLDCAEQFPEGRDSLVSLALEPCGCASGSDCEAACEGKCAGDEAPSSCELCLFEALLYGFACATPVYPYCTDQCTLYLICGGVLP